MDFGKVSFANLELNPPEGAGKQITVHFGEAFKEGSIDRRADDGLIESKEIDITKQDIVDWTQKQRDGYVFTPRNTVVNAFHLEAMKLMAIMARDLGWEDDAREFEDSIATSRKAFQNTFFGSEKGLYRDGIGTDHISLHANLFPVAFDLEPEEKGKEIAKRMAGRGMKRSVYAARHFVEPTSCLPGFHAGIAQRQPRSRKEGSKPRFPHKLPGSLLS